MGICIVDDSEISRMQIKKTLKMFNYELSIEAVDGLDALNKIKNFTGVIDLYILDINMPKMDGLTLIDEIRKFDNVTPVIILTSELDKQKVKIAKEKGAYGWVVKPFDQKKLYKIIKMVIKKRGRHVE